MDRVEPPEGATKRSSSGRSILRTAFIFLIAAGLFAGVTSITAANVLRRLSPELALRFMPVDARANAASANEMIMRHASRMAGPARERAVRALTRDPTAVDAADALAILDSLQNRNDLADRRFQYAERMSRRDSAAQLWFIERRVQANDIAGALHHYDIALSTSLGARQQLLPILIAAASDRGIVTPLRNLLRTRPIWRDNFLNRLVSEGSDAQAMIAVSNGVLDLQAQPDRHYLDIMMARLVQMHAYEQAWRGWHAVSRDRAPALLRDGQFRVSDGLAPFAWTFSTEPGLMPERRPRTRPADGFALYLPASSEDGEAAIQLLRLPAGRHDFVADVGDVRPDPDSRPHLEIRCAAEGGTVVLNQPFPATGAGTLRASFSIPPDCPFQWIAIQVRGDLGGESAGNSWIGSLRIR